MVSARTLYHLVLIYPNIELWLKGKLKGKLFVRKHRHINAIINRIHPYYPWDYPKVLSISAIQKMKYSTSVNSIVDGLGSIAISIQADDITDVSYEKIKGKLLDKFK